MQKPAVNRNPRRSSTPSRPRSPVKPVQISIIYQKHALNLYGEKLDIRNSANKRPGTSCESNSIYHLRSPDLSGQRFTHMPCTPKLIQFHPDLPAQSKPYFKPRLHLISRSTKTSNINSRSSTPPRFQLNKKHNKSLHRLFSEEVNKLISIFKL